MGNLDILFVTFDAGVTASEHLCCDQGRSRSGERIEHNDAIRHACKNAGFDEIRREGSEVPAFVWLGS